jgi:hypothetical protein
VPSVDQRLFFCEQKNVIDFGLYSSARRCAIFSPAAGS